VVVMTLMVIVVLVVTNLVVLVALVVKVGVVLVTPAWCTPHLDLGENIGFTSLGTTSFTPTPDPLVQL